MSFYQVWVLYFPHFQFLCVFVLIYTCRIRKVKQIKFIFICMTLSSFVFRVCRSSSSTERKQVPASQPWQSHKAAISTLVSAMLISVHRSGTRLSVRGFSNFNWNEAYRPGEDTATRRGVCSICAHGSLAALHSFDKKNLQRKPMQPKNCTANGVPLGSCKQLSHGPVIIPSKSVCLYDIHLVSFTTEQPDFIQTGTSQEPPSSVVYLMDHARRQDMVMISSVIRPQINPSRPDVQPSINPNPEPDLTPPLSISPHTTHNKPRCTT